MKKLESALMVGLVGSERPDQREMFRLLGELRQVLAKPQPRRFRLDRLERAAGINARLRVKRIDMAGTAIQPDHHATLRLRTLRSKLGLDKRRKRQAKGSRDARGKKTAAIDLV